MNKFGTTRNARSTPPSRAWLFAQALLGNPLPDPSFVNSEARAKRERLEWLARFSSEHATQLRRLLSDEAEVRRQRKQLEWLAKISPDHESQLRSLERNEAELREAQEYCRELAASVNLQEAEWDPAKHPRGAFAQNPGWFSPTSGAGASGKSSGSGSHTIAGLSSNDGGKTPKKLQGFTQKSQNASKEKAQPANGPGNSAPVGSIKTKQQLPADHRGTWVTGSKGHGTFLYNDLPENKEAGTAGKELRFEHEYVAIGGFPPEAYYGGSADKASVQIETVTGLGVDNLAADAAMRLKRNDPTWKRPDGYLWNHAGPPGSKTVELIDKAHHRAMSHKGSGAEARALNRLARRGRTTGRAMGVLTVYLTVRDVLQAAGALRPDHVVLEREIYEFKDEDGSVFIVRPAGLFSGAKREFVEGPRQGEVEAISNEDVEKYRKIAEEEWGKYIPGTVFSDPRFIPGRKRKSIPWTIDVGGVPADAGYIDAEGKHRNPGRLVPYI